MKIFHKIHELTRYRTMQLCRSTKASGKVLYDCAYAWMSQVLCSAIVALRMVLVVGSPARTARTWTGGSAPAQSRQRLRATRPHQKTLKIPRQVNKYDTCEVQLVSIISYYDRSWDGHISSRVSEPEPPGARVFGWSRTVTLARLWIQFQF